MGLPETEAGGTPFVLTLFDNKATRVAVQRYTGRKSISTKYLETTREEVYTTLGHFMVVSWRHFFRSYIF